MLTFIGLFLTACAGFAYLFQEPQLAVAAGGSIHKGTVNTIYKGLGSTVIIILVILILVAFIIPCFTYEIKA